MPVSLTVLFFAGFFVLLGIAAAFLIITAVKDTVWSGIVTAFVVACAVASLVLGFWSYNQNIRESHQNCLDSSGFIYDGKCIDRIPLEIQRL